MFHSGFGGTAGTQDVALVREVPKILVCPGNTFATGERSGRN